MDLVFIIQHDKIDYFQPTFKQLIILLKKCFILEPSYVLPPGFIKKKSFNEKIILKK